MTAPDRARRPLVDLFRDLSQQAYALVRQEMALAASEVSERTQTLVRDALWIGAGVLLLHVALGTAVAAIVFALAATGMPLPAAAALPAAVLAVTAALIVRSRLSVIKRRSAAARTLHDIKETAQWLPNQTREPGQSTFSERSTVPGR